MLNYENVKFYTIRSPSLPDGWDYIGSTTQSLTKAMAAYRQAARKNVGGGSIELNIRNTVVRQANAYIKLIKNYPCENVQQLKKEKARMIERSDCLNKLLSGCRSVFEQNAYFRVLLREVRAEEARSNTNSELPKKSIEDIKAEIAANNSWFAIMDQFAREQLTT